MSHKTLYLSRITGAVFVLVLSIGYLAGYVGPALSGFVLVGLVGGSIGYLINNGTLPAVCDICGGRGVFSAEYGHGFRNVRLILDCPHCGRVINRSGQGVVVEKEQP